ncbi:MAG: hypothetical protein DKM24_00530 [Candidatus Melainabacteria bacterium]|nr:MAG: hypothetical protein DKM24_00530 [Candidatus Melainabacteria bacterium]
MTSLIIINNGNMFLTTGIINKILETHASDINASVDYGNEMSENKNEYVTVLNITNPSKAQEIADKLKSLQNVRVEIIEN